MAMIEPIIDDDERREINEHISRLLKDLGNPEPPLDLATVRQIQRLDLSYYSKSDLNLLDEMRHRAIMAGQQITSTAKNMQELVSQFCLKGLLLQSHGEKKILIDDDVVQLKRRFLIAHEIMHDLLPWHRALLIGDNEQTLNPTFHQAMEAEANYGGRRLIFMGGQFQKEALDSAFDWKAIQKLKTRFGNPLKLSLFIF